MDDNVESRRGLAERMYVYVCVCVWCRVGNGRQPDKERWLGGLRVGAGQVALAIAGWPGRLLGHLRAGSGAAGAEAGRNPDTQGLERGSGL